MTPWWVLIIVAIIAAAPGVIAVRRERQRDRVADRNAATKKEVEEFQAIVAGFGQMAEGHRQEFIRQDKEIDDLRKQLEEEREACAQQMAALSERVKKVENGHSRLQAIVQS